MPNEIAFEMATSNIRFGPGATREVGMDLADLKASHVMVLTDPVLRKLPPVAAVLDSLEEQKIRYSLFDRVRVEPTDESFKEAIAFAAARDIDAFVAVGGGSPIDTVQKANPHSPSPAD